MTPSRHEGAACRYCQGDHNQRVTVDRELLIQLEDLLDDYSDVRDGDYGEPRPNRAMQLLQDVRAVLEGSSEGSGAILHPVSPLSSFSTTGAEEPSGTTEGGTDECGVEGHAAQDRMRCLEGSAGQPRLVAGLSGTAPTEDQRGNSGAGIRPGHSSVAPHADTVPPVADLGPAEAQPARDPASDVHAGGGEPARTLRWRRHVRIRCPKCDAAQPATVEAYDGDWPIYVHECGCGYLIQESEWEEQPDYPGYVTFPVPLEDWKPLLPDYVTPLRKLAAELGIKK